MVVSIDLGIKGCLTIFNNHDIIKIVKFDTRDYYNTLLYYKNDISNIVIEQSLGFKYNSAKSRYTFGLNQGKVYGILEILSLDNLTIHFTPCQWQKILFKKYDKYNDIELIKLRVFNIVKDFYDNPIIYNKRNKPNFDITDSIGIGLSYIL